MTWIGWLLYEWELLKGMWRNSPLRNTQIGKSSAFTRTSSWNAKSLTFLASQPLTVIHHARKDERHKESDRALRRMFYYWPQNGSGRATLFFFLLFIGVKLLYNVVLVSAVQQSESAISPLFFRFPSHSGYHSQPLNSFLHPIFPLGIITFVLYFCVSISSF